MRKYVGKEISHEVKAFKIESITPDEDVLVLEGEGCSVDVLPVWANIAKPQVGGYYVKFKKRHGGGAMCLDAETFLSVYKPLDAEKKAEAPIKGTSEVKLNECESSRSGRFVKDLHAYQLKEADEEPVYAMKVHAMGKCDDCTHAHLIGASSNVKVSNEGLMEALDAAGRKPMFVKWPNGTETLEDGELFLTLYERCDMEENHDDVGDHLDFIEKSVRAAFNLRQEDIANKAEKSLSNTDANGARKNVKDIEIWGDGDTFKLICKASSKAEGWMKSTKAMEVPGIGCVVQVTTQQKNPDGSYSVAEALTFVPGAVIMENRELHKDGHTVTGRELVKEPLSVENMELNALRDSIVNEAANDTFGEQTLAESVKSILEGKERVGAFEKVVAPLIEYLNEHHDPHHSVIVTPTGAELVGGVIGVHTMKYVKD